MCASQSNILDNVQVVKEADRYVLTGNVQWTGTRLRVQLADEQAPDQLQREVEKMGQQIKREAYGKILQQVEGQLVSQFQLANPNLQRRGTRSYTFVAPFGKVQIQRTRLGAPTARVPANPKMERAGATHLANAAPTLLVAGIEGGRVSTSAEFVCSQDNAGVGRTSRHAEIDQSCHRCQFVSSRRGSAGSHPASASGGYFASASAGLLLRFDAANGRSRRGG